MKNFGLLISKEARAKDWVFGGVTGIIAEPLTQGQWDNYLPLFEPQAKNFETMGCVTFSALNCLETLYKRRYNIEENFSDRAVASLSETTVNGNYLDKVAETIRKFGLVEEQYYPWGGKNWNEYMQPVPHDIVERSKLSLERYKINWEWVLERGTEEVKNALNYSPLQVTVYAWEKPVNGIYQKTNKTTNHAVMLYGYEDGKYWKIYDQYENDFKKLAWDFNFGHRLRYNIENAMPEKKYKDNILVQLVDAPGGFGMTLDGKLVVDDLDKLIAVWLVRNNPYTGEVDIDDDPVLKGKTLSMRKADWDLLQKINLRKESI